jgi:hypothetical protein
MMEQVTQLQHQLSSKQEEMEALKTNHHQQIMVCANIKLIVDDDIVLIFSGVFCIQELEANHQQQWREKDLDHEKKVS